MTIQQFNNLAVQQQEEELFKCCSSTLWSQKIAEKFPFNTIAELKNESDKIWFSLNEKDWLEAFTQHPKIGDIKSLEKNFSSTANWASGEQSGVNTATQTVFQELKEANEEYAKKFGYIFIVCATGKSAEEMLAILKQRLTNDPSEEIKIAIHEQNKITHLRLDKLFA